MLRLKPRLLQELDRYDSKKFRADLLAGLTVGIIAVPLAMAFAIASGVSPEQGLVTAVVAGLIVSGLGGTRLCVAGPTGAFIVILYGILVRYGLANLLICTMMAGGMLIAMGLLGLGRLIRFIPNTVIIGFTNGIAVLIALTQVKDLLGLPIEAMPAEFFGIVKTLYARLPEFNPSAVGLAGVSFLFLWFWPKRWSQIVPSPFLVIILTTLFVAMSHLEVATIGSRFPDIRSTWPEPRLPQITLEQIGSLITPALTIALLAAIESLLCAVVADKQTHDQHEPNTELVAQGIANLVSPIFGGLAITSAIARTSANIRNGATSPMAGVIHGLTVLVILLVAAPLMRHIPLPALAAILLWVAFNMGEWSAFRTLGQYTPMRNLVMLSTFALTVLFDLTVAVEVGMVLATLLLIKRLTEAARFDIVSDLRTVDDEPGMPLPDQATAMRLRGALFFGISDSLEQATRQVGSARVILLDWRSVIYLDTTALETLHTAFRRWQARGTRIICFGLDAQARSLFERAGILQDLQALELVKTPRQAIDRAEALLSTSAAA